MEEEMENPEEGETPALRRDSPYGKKAVEISMDPTAVFMLFLAIMVAMGLLYFFKKKQMELAARQLPKLPENSFSREQPVPLNALGGLESEIAEQNRLMRLQIPRGEQSYPKHLTTDTNRFDLDVPWTGFSLINDGPDSIKLGINMDGQHDMVDNVEIKQNETYNLDMKAPIIRRLYLSAINTTADVRIHAKEGYREV